MKIPFSHIIFLFASLWMLSCTERIDIELDSSFTRLVVYGEITSEDKFHNIILSKTSDYFFNQPAPAVSGAEIEVFNDTMSILFIEQPDLPGTYTSTKPFSGRVGTIFNLRISNVDMDEDGEAETYSSSAKVPAVGQLDSISISYFDSPFASGYQIYMYAEDPPTREWYSFKIFRNGNLLTDTLIKFAVQTDDFFNGTYIYGLPVGFLNDENPVEAGLPGDTVTLELNSITEAFYDFIISAQSEIFGSNPLFGGPPANVVTNIDNGATGIFTATSILSISETIPAE